MSMLPCINKLERPTQRLAKARRIVAYDSKAAASFRSIERKGRNDGVPSHFQGSLKARDIGGAVTLLGEKVKRRPIMPDVVSLSRLPDGSIRYNPLNPCSAASKAIFCGL